MEWLSELVSDESNHTAALGWVYGNLALLAGWLLKRGAGAVHSSLSARLILRREAREQAETERLRARLARIQCNAATPPGVLLVPPPAQAPWTEKVAKAAALGFGRDPCRACGSLTVRVGTPENGSPRRHLKCEGCGREELV